MRAGGTYVWEVRNLTDGLHNFHLHGWSFQKIETEWVDMDDPGNPLKNFVVPATVLENKDTQLLPRRLDTVIGRSWTISRFAVTFIDTGRPGQVEAAGKEPTAQRSGGWLIHCHILEHAAAGMMSFFEVSN